MSCTSLLTRGCAMASTSLAGVQLATPDLRRSSRRRSRFWRLPILPAVILGTVLIAGIAAPWIAPHDPIRGVLSDRLLPPVWSDGGSTRFLLGTDHLGRDVLS